MCLVLPLVVISSKKRNLNSVAGKVGGRGKDDGGSRKIV